MYAETVGKVFARNFLYYSFLPDALPEVQMHAGELLVLLGQEALELPLIENLGIPLSQVHSIEREPELYQAQREMLDGEVNLYCMELIDFIHHNLRSNRRFLVLNLDICGTYLNGIDPALTTILHFVRRNPQTVVATYTSAGRDRDQLLEGLKSLALFLWIDPEATHGAVSRLVPFYQAGGMSTQVSWNMTLRHMFWVRSHLEHIAASAHGVGRADAQAVAELFEEFGQNWEILARQAPLPLKYYTLKRLAAELPLPLSGEAVLDVGLEKFQLLTYAASSNFYHSCYFSLYSSLKRMYNVREWLSLTLDAFVRTPPIFVNGEGDVLQTEVEPTEPSRSARLWGPSELMSPMRRVAIPPMSEQLALSTVELGATWPLDGRTIAKIYQYCGQGMNTRDMLPLLPPGIDPKRVTAHLARARRAMGSR